MKNLFIGVGNAMSVFVHKLRIKIIANQGPVKIQAQNDLMALIARGELNLTSTEDEIHLIAKKKVTINGGRSYITLDANGIESATQGSIGPKPGITGEKIRPMSQKTSRMGHLKRPNLPLTSAFTDKESTHDYQSSVSEK